MKISPGFLLRSFKSLSLIFFSILFIVLLPFAAANASPNYTGLIPTDPASDTINWAHKSNGTTISGTQTAHLNNGEYEGFSTHSIQNIPSKQAVLLDFGQVRTLSFLEIHLYDGDARFFRYIVEGSVDGVTYTKLVDKSTGKHHGLQRLPVNQAKVRYLKILGTYSSADASFHLIDEIIAAGYAQTTPFPKTQIQLIANKHFGTTHVPGVGMELAAGLYEIKYLSGATSIYPNDQFEEGKSWGVELNVSIPTTNRTYYFGNIHNRITRYPTALAAELDNKEKSFTVYMPYRGKVHFWVYDDNITDNRGTTNLEIKQLSGASESLLFRVRDAMTRSVLWQQREVGRFESWLKPNEINPSCFGCHEQAQVILGLNESQAKLPELPISKQLQDLTVDIYRLWQKSDGLVSPHHNEFFISQTSMWAWSASSFKNINQEKIFAALIRSVDWLISRQNAAGGWENDYWPSYTLFGDGSPSATHTAGNITALAKLLEVLQQSRNEIAYYGASITGNSVDFSQQEPGTIKFKFDQITDITGVRVTVSDSFFSNGNFIINELTGYDQDANRKFSSTEGPSPDGNFPAGEAINAITTDINDGWGIWPNNSRLNPGVMLFKYANPTDLDALSLVQIYPGHQVKKIKFEYTTEFPAKATSVFKPLVISDVVVFETSSNTLHAKYLAALRKAAKQFLLVDWPWSRNARTAAQTIMGLHDAIPFLELADGQAALARIKTITTFLKQRQTTGAGWAETLVQTDPPQVLQSALVMRALLLSLDNASDPAILNGAEFLLNTQQNDGGWSSPPLKQRVAATTWVEIALPILFDRLQEIVQRNQIDDLIASGEHAAVEITWTPIESAASYNIYRQNEGSDFALIKSAHVTDVAKYRDLDVIDEVTYTYKVRWLDSNGVESEDSNEASGTPYGLQCGDDTPPRIVSNPITGAAQGAEYKYKVEAIDPDPNEIIFYSLPSAPTGMIIDNTTGLITWSPQEAQIGTHFVKVRVEDRIGRFATQAYRVRVASIFINRKPSFFTSPELNLIAQYPYEYRARAFDPNITDILTYSAITPPVGMNINPTTGRITWKPAANQVGPHPTGAKVVDLGGLSDEQTFTLGVVANTPPTIESLPNTAGRRNRTYIYEVLGKDQENGPLKYYLTKSQPGMSIDKYSGRIVWLPGDTFGSFDVTVQVEDQGLLRATQEYKIIIPENEPPEILSTPSEIAGKNQLYKYKVITFDPEEQKVTLKLLKAPTGMTLAGDLIEWVPTEVPTLPVDVEIEARDPKDAIDTQSFKITVVENNDIQNPPGGPVVQVITPAANSTLTTRTTIKGNITFNGQNPYTWKTSLLRQGTSEALPMLAGTGNVTSGDFATVDPRLLPTDAYELIVQVTKGSLTWTYRFPYNLQSDLKLGNFKLSITDLTIPFAGIPIDITRNYDSIDTAKYDFGAGWRLRLPGKVVDSALEDPLEPYTEGTRVFVTKPDGKRVGFKFTAFKPTLTPFRHPSFTPDPGVSDTLESDFDVLFATDNGYFHLFGEYNPTTFILTTKERLRYVIDENVGIVSVTDANKNSIHFNENSIQHSSGGSLALTRDAQKRITKIVDLKGKEIKYEYDTKGDLVKFTNQLGETVKYKYDSFHRIVEIKDTNDKVLLINTYDLEGKLFQQTDPNGKIVQITTNLDQNSEAITDRRGNTSVYKYDKFGNVLQKVDPDGNTATYTYDANLNKTSEVDPLGNTKKWEYDSNNNIVSYTNANGVSTTYTYNSLGQELSKIDGNNKKTTKTYDLLGNLTEEKDADGHIRKFAYDSAGNKIQTTDAKGGITRFATDSTGRITQVIDQNNTIVNYQNDQNGNILQQIVQAQEKNGSIRSIQTNVSYDGMNQPTKILKATGESRIIEYKLNLPTKILDSKGNTTSYEYDTLGNKTAIIFPDGSGESLKYDEENNLIERIDREKRRTSMEYDKLNRLTKITFQDLASTQRLYDKAGRVVAYIDENNNKTSYQYDKEGNRIAIEDAFGNVTSMTYDPEGRLVKTADRNGVATNYQLDSSGRRIKTIFNDKTFVESVFDAEGQELERRDPEGNVTKFIHDAIGNLLSVTDSEKGTTTYEYDAVGNKIKQTDANNNSTHYEYDLLGRVTKKILPMRQEESIAYDLNGNIKTIKSFNNDIVEFEYDSNNRLVRKKFPDLSTVVYEYFKSGERKRIIDVNGVTEYSYDGRARLRRIAYPNGKYVEYEYDAVGNRTKLKTMTQTVEYSYNGLNRLDQVSSSGQLIRYSYDKEGNEIAAVYPNGIKSEKIFDSVNRLRRIELKNLSSSQILQSFEYSLDKNGNRIGLSEASGRTTLYKYDKLNRMVSEIIQEPGVETPLETHFMYDKTGNRISRTELLATTDYTYDNNDRLISAGGIKFEYDNSGNLLKEVTPIGVISYSWDFENRLVAVASTSGVTHYTYDADGIRTSESRNGLLTQFLIDPNQDYQQVIEELNASNITLTTYLRGNDLVRQTQGSSVSYFHQDAIGSTSVLTNVLGEVTDRYRFKPFGEMRSKSGSSVNKYLFAGESYDLSANGYYLRARYYRQDLGRFLGRDPVNGSELSPLLSVPYMYAGNNPLINTDPSGKNFISYFLTAAGTGAVTGGIKGLINSKSGVELWREVVCGGVNGAIAGGTVGVVGKYFATAILLDPKTAALVGVASGVGPIALEEIWGGAYKTKADVYDAVLDITRYFGFPDAIPAAEFVSSLLKGFGSCNLPN